MKKLVSFLLVLLSIAWSAQAADLPYKTYVYDAYKNERAIPMFYEPAACETLALKKAADLCCSDGLIYVLDAGSDRILVLDRDMTPVRKLENLGTKSASGLYVDAQGNIALADTGNQRALVLDAQGNVLLTLTAPIPRCTISRPPLRRTRCCWTAPGMCMFPWRACTRAPWCSMPRGNSRGTMAATRWKPLPRC